MRTITSLTVALVATVSSSALADNKMQIGAFGGVHFWNDNNELGDAPAEAAEAIEDSPIFGVRVARAFHEAVSIEGELALAPSRTAGSGTDVVGIGYRLQALVHPARFVDGKLQPFALLGIGGFTAATTDRAVLRKDADFAWHAGVGVTYRVGRDWGVRFDARLIVPPAHDGLATIDGELLFGIFKTFPGKPDPAAAPPTQAPPAPTPTDGDGDGVLDTNDRCPTEGEDLDGFGDDDGCPDPDNDGDGVPDAADKCEKQAETANGYQDDDGCPDEPPAAIKQFTGVIRGIDFETGSATLTPSSSQVLDEAVKALRDFPALRLQIIGHTDSQGGPAFNRDLSQRRAEAVKAYFVAGGIAAERLEAIGRGADQPLEDNSTPEGRAKNRRVELGVR